jgi:hypothetical protein
VAEPTKRNRVWYVVGCVGLAILTVPCIGVAAAIAIPAFVNYSRRAKTVEARTNVAMIVRGVESYCAAERASPTGAVTNELPPALAPTLASPGPEAQITTLAPGWADVGFSVADPLRYAYSIERPSGTIAVVVAEGDLNGNGLRSRFESTCTLAGTSCTCTPVSATDELE